MLIPILCKELLPGDSISYNNIVLARLAPMLAPIMHKMNITITHHAVANRLLWPTGYEKFFANPIPNENTPVAPYFADIFIQPNELGDYFGLPIQTPHNDNGTPFTQYETIDKVSALPFAAYQKIYNDWYRDQNLVNVSNGEGQPYPDTLTDGLNQYSDFKQLRRRAWQHDYFTASLPFAQKGEAVEIPISNFEDVPVLNSRTPVGGDFKTAWNTLGGYEARVDNVKTDSFPGETFYAKTSDLSDQAAVTINTLRWAVRLQEFLEKNARGGTRYIELVRSHFGVRSSDARFQRSEFLGWSNNPVVISEVLQQSATTDDGTPQGEMAGHGISVGGSKSVTYFAEEHGFFISILSIRPKTAYSQGIDKMFSRFSAMDYAWPDFAHLGEQEVKYREIYYNGTATDDETFGYMQRYAEYKYSNDRVAGEFRTNLNFWHMGRIFTELPLLNQAFIEARPTKRIFAVNLAGVNNYYINVSHKLTMRRKLPKQGIPSL